MHRSVRLFTLTLPNHVVRLNILRPLHHYVIFRYHMIFTHCFLLCLYIPTSVQYVTYLSTITLGLVMYNRTRWVFLCKQCTTKRRKKKCARFLQIVLLIYILEYSDQQPLLLRRQKKKHTHIHTCQEKTYR